MEVNVGVNKLVAFLAFLHKDTTTGWAENAERKIKFLLWIRWVVLKFLECSPRLKCKFNEGAMYYVRSIYKLFRIIKIGKQLRSWQIGTGSKTKGRSLCLLGQRLRTANILEICSYVESEQNCFRKFMCKILAHNMFAR